MAPCLITGAIAPEDRWAVAAYIRALQLSQAASSSDVPAGVQVQRLSDSYNSKTCPSMRSHGRCQRQQYRLIRTRMKERPQWLPGIRLIH